MRLDQSAFASWPALLVDDFEVNEISKDEFEVLTLS
jgi:hypothetical protein